MRLDPRAAIYLVLRTALSWLLVSIWLAAMFWGSRFVVVALGMICGFGAIAWCWCWIKIRSYRIDLGETGVALEYGVFAKAHEMVLYNKIQDILVTRNLLERMLGLSTVTVQTASGTPERVPGLAAADAEALRDDLVRRASPVRAERDS